jgi:hypothetical protein
MRALDVPAEDANRLRQTCRRFVQRSGALLLRSLARRGGSAVNGTGAAALRSSGARSLSRAERSEMEWKILQGKTHTYLGRTTRDRASASASARRRRTSAADFGRHSALQMGQRRSADERAPIRGEATHSVRLSAAVLCARSAGERRSRTCAAALT